MHGLPTLTWFIIVAAWSVGLSHGFWRRAAAEFCTEDANPPGLLELLADATGIIAFISGSLVDEFGPRAVLCVGLVLMAVGATSLTKCHSSGGRATAVCLGGAGFASLQVAVVVLMPLLWLGDHPAAALNVGFLFFYLGLQIAPGVADIVRARLGSKRALTLLALLGALLVVPILFAPLPEAETRDRSVKWLEAVGHPLLWLSILIYLLLGVLKRLLDEPTTEYLQGLRFAPSAVQIIQMVVWAMFLGSQLLAAYLLQQDTISAGWLMLLLAVCAAIAFGNVAGTHGRGLAVLALVVFAACLGPLAPTLVGLLFQSVAPERWGMTYGVLFTMYTCGNFVLRRSPVQTRSIRASFPVACGIGLALASVALAMLLTQ